MRTIFFVFNVLFMVSTAVSGGVTVYGNVRTMGVADNGATIIQEGDSHLHVTFSRIVVNGNVRYLCNADNASTCQQNGEYGDCKYYSGTGIVCSRN